MKATSPGECPEKDAGVPSCYPTRSGIFAADGREMDLHVGRDMQNDISCMANANGVLMGCSTFDQVADTRGTQSDAFTRITDAFTRLTTSWCIVDRGMFARLITCWKHVLTFFCLMCRPWQQLRRVLSAGEIAGVCV